MKLVTLIAATALATSLATGAFASVDRTGAPAARHELHQGKKHDRHDAKEHHGKHHRDGSRDHHKGNHR